MRSTNSGLFSIAKLTADFLDQYPEMKEFIQEIYHHIFKQLKLPNYTTITKNTFIIGYDSQNPEPLEKADIIKNISKFLFLHLHDLKNVQFMIQNKDFLKIINISSVMQEYQKILNKHPQINSFANQSVREKSEAENALDKDSARKESFTGFFSALIKPNQQQEELKENQNTFTPISHDLS